MNGANSKMLEDVNVADDELFRSHMTDCCTTISILPPAFGPKLPRTHCACPRTQD